MQVFDCLVLLLYKRFCGETILTTPLQFWKRRLLFWAGALLVGATAILFALAANYAQALFHRAARASVYLPIVITPAGFAVVAVLTRKLFPGSQGSGIPQTIAALEIPDHDTRRKLLSLRMAVAKISLTLLGLGAGASIGREGPTVQVGASIMHGFGRFAKFSHQEIDRGLILAGGAAGIAAAFNTPLAGVVFAIEELSRSFEQRTSGTILIAVILAGVVSLAMLGNYTYFGHTAVTMTLGADWLAVAVCGVLGGVFGGAFSRLLIVANRGLPGKLGILVRERPVVFALLCGILVALLGVASGDTVFCTGYDEAKSILEGGQQPASFGPLKILATVVSYMSGIPGGIFSPSLSAGAGLGALIATFFSATPAGAIVILSMVAYFSGVVQSPITAFVIVMEMTDNHGMLLPLMATSLIASTMSRLICPIPVYQALAKAFLDR